MDDPPANDSPSIESFQERLRQGDSDASQELFDRYSGQLVRLATANIHPMLQRRFDGEDVVQSVFRTFFRRHQEIGFQIEQSQQLWQLLVALTLYKTRTHARKHTAAKRNVAVDQAIVDQLAASSGEPSPDEAIAMWEELGIVLDGLPDRTAEIVSMRLEGKARTEIAGELNLSRQTIHRLLKLVQDRLNQRLVDLSDGSSPNSEKTDEIG